MKRLLVLNPRAASGRAERFRMGIESALREQGSLDVFVTESPGHASTYLEQSDLSGYDCVISAGGDGTLFETVNGLYRNRGERRPALGVIPIGTGNAFARELDLLPGDWEKAVQIVMNNRRQYIDVGHAECADGSFYFLNIIGAGLPVDAMQQAESFKFLGNSAYTLSTLWQLLRLKSHRIKYRVDERKVSQDVVFIEIANTRYTGTRFMIAPGARFDDGLLDVVTLRRSPRRRLLRLFPTIYQGRHVDHPEVGVSQGRKIVIEAPAGMLLAPDGERTGTTPATIRCLHRDLELLS